MSRVPPVLWPPPPERSKLGLTTAVALIIFACSIIWLACTTLSFVALVYLPEYYGVHQEEGDYYSRFDAALSGLFGFLLLQAVAFAAAVTAKMLTSGRQLGGFAKIAGFAPITGFAVVWLAIIACLLYKSFKDGL